MPKCLECDTPFRGRSGQRIKLYCSAPCRAKFNNRRLKRGAEVYDLLMAVRFDRAAAVEANAWTKLCALCAHYRDEDHRERAGRRSWDTMLAVFERNGAIFNAVRLKQYPRS
jgi:hypothetical protein